MNEYPKVWVVRGWGQVLDVSLREVDAVGSANPAPTVTECVAVPRDEWERRQRLARFAARLLYYYHRGARDAPPHHGKHRASERRATRETPVSSEPLDLDAVEALCYRVRHDAPDDRPEAPELVPVILQIVARCRALEADVKRLRARTHELQENCDKKVSGMQAEMRESRFWVDAYKHAETALAEYRKQDGIAQHSILQHMAYAVLLRRVEALEAGPSDEQLDVAIDDLDDYAAGVDKMEWGLPLVPEHRLAMRAIIRAAWKDGAA